LATILAPAGTEQTIVSIRASDKASAFGLLMASAYLLSMPTPGYAKDHRTELVRTITRGSAMRTITNNYRDTHVLNLGSGDERGPYLVTQTGVSPNDPLAKERMFVLRPDGRWVDFNAYACQGKPEVLDEAVFPTMAEVMTTFGRLTGPPQVVDLPIDELVYVRQRQLALRTLNCVLGFVFVSEFGARTVIVRSCQIEIKQRILFQVAVELGSFQQICN
jgi:hypothetical protein